MALRRILTTACIASILAPGAALVGCSADDAADDSSTNLDVCVLAAADPATCAGTTTLTFADVPPGEAATQQVRLTNALGGELRVDTASASVATISVSLAEGQLPITLATGESLVLDVVLAAGLAPGPVPEATVQVSAGGVETTISVAGTIAACAAPRDSCDGDWSNGCETDTTSALGHCGGCGQSCAQVGVIVECAASACATVACEPNRFGPTCAPCPGLDAGKICDAGGACADGLDGTGACTCYAGYLPSESGGCVDADECAGEDGGDDCLADATCSNWEGSFSCACAEGTFGDGRVCDCENRRVAVAWAPERLAFGPDGSLYVTTPKPGPLRRLRPGGDWEDVVDSAGSRGALAAPTGVTVTADGTIFVADRGNGVIRRLARKGVWEDAVDQAGGDGSVNRPLGLAVSPDGTIYLADSDNNLVKVLPPGGFWEVLSDSKASAGGLNGPSSVAIAPDGAVIVGSSGSGELRKLGRGGDWETVVDSEGSRGEFTALRDVVALPDGTLVVTQQVGPLRRLAPGGAWEELADEGSGAAGLSAPRGVAVDLHGPNGLAGTIVVADALAATIRRVAPGAEWTDIADASGYPGGVRTPGGLAVTAEGDVLLTAEEKADVLRLGSDGGWTRIGGDEAGWFGTVSVGPDGAIYAIRGRQADRKKVWRLNAAPPHDVVRDASGGDGAFVSAAGVDAASNGTVFVLDRDLKLVRYVVSGGKWADLEDKNGGTGDFERPEGLAVTPSSVVFVSDRTLNVVRRLAPAGAWENVMDSGGSVGGLDEPLGLDVGTDGTLYVADPVIGVVARLAPGGAWEGVAGVGGMQWVAVNADQSRLFAASRLDGLHVVALQGVGLAPGGACRLQVGSVCEAPGQCASGDCVGGVCAGP